MNIEQNSVQFLLPTPYSLTPIDGFKNQTGFLYEQTRKIKNTHITKLPETEIPYPPANADHYDVVGSNWWRKIQIQRSDG